MQLVCRLWQEAIASSPSLWSNINTSMKVTPDKFSALLKSSDTMPLDIVLTSGTAPGRPIRFKRIRELLEALEEEDHRLRSLKFVASYGAIVFMMKRPLFEGALPCLETLTLDVGGADTFSEALYYCAYELPELFQGNPEATPLKRLTLCAAVPWPNNRFPHLTHLSISYADPGSGRAFYASEFLEFMRTTPNLAHLTLDTIGKLEPPQGNVAVSMPNLREVRIRNCIWFTGAIVLGHLVLPATTSVEVSSIIYGMGHNLLKWLLGRDATYLRNAGAPTKLALALRGHTIYLSCSGPSGSTEVKLNARVKQHSLSEYRHRWHTTALCMLPLSLDLADVEDLSLAMTTDAFVPSHVVRAFLLRMPKVRSCTVLMDPRLESRYWTRCLSPRDTGSAPLPRLQSLEVIGRLAETWDYAAAQLASLVVRRSQGGCEKLAELVCSTLFVPAPWPGGADSLKVGKHNVADIVESVRLQSLSEFPLLRAAEVQTWDASESQT